MDLKVGDAYANDSGAFAREILALENGDVSYREFTLADGQPLTSYRVCRRGTFRRWAARPCTTEEIARFRRDVKPISDQILIDLIGATAIAM